MPICISDISGNALKGKIITEISAGSRSHIIAIDTEGKVYTWGYNYYGQLGDGTTKGKSAPVCISNISENILNGKKIVQISAGKYYCTAAVDEDSKVYTWGYNYYGQLGDGTTTNSNVPICISNMTGNILQEKKITQISLGDNHMVALDIDEKVYTWGSNSYGQLGQGLTSGSNVPICISDMSESILGKKKVVQISAGDWQTVAIDEEGKVYTWGSNYYGQLGDGTNMYSFWPMCISDMSKNALQGKKY